MKYLNKILLGFCMLFYVLGLRAQLPQSINFQGVATNGESILKNEVIGLKLSVVDSAQGGKVVYKGFYGRTTNEFGSFQLQVGKHDYRIGSARFEDINWQTGKKHLKISFSQKPDQSDSIDLGTVEMATVPFAFAAESVTNIHDENAQKGDVMVFNGQNWVPGDTILFSHKTGMIDELGAQQGDLLVFNGTNWASGKAGERRVVAKINYSVKVQDDLIDVNAKDNDVSITLPLPTNYTRTLRIRALDASNDVIVKNVGTRYFALGNGDSSEVIRLASPGDYLEMYSDGTKWIVSTREMHVFVDLFGASGQKVSTSTATNITWSTENEDSYDAFDYRFDVPTGASGTYMLSAFIDVANVNGIDWDVSEYLDIRLRVNSESSAKVLGRDRMGTFNDSQSRGGRSTGGTRLLHLHEEDYVNVEVYHNIGGDLVIDFAAIYITRIGN